MNNSADPVFTADADQRHQQDRQPRHRDRALETLRCRPHHHDHADQNRYRVQHGGKDRGTAIAERVAGRPCAFGQHRRAPGDQQTRYVGQVMRGIGQQRE